MVAGEIPRPDASVAPSPTSLPHLWDLRSGNSISLRGLGPAPDDVTDGAATDVDDRGVAVGWLATSASASETHAVVFDRYEAP